MLLLLVYYQRLKMRHKYHITFKINKVIKNTTHWHKRYLSNVTKFSHLNE